MVPQEAGEGDDGPFRRIAIVGFGLIGASIALAARRRWPSIELAAIDRQPIVDTAIRTHAADSGGEAVGLVEGAELIVLAAPVLANVRILSELPAHIAGHAIVTDVGSTKRQIAAAAAALPTRVTFIGGHPLAGAALGGLDQARADLFADRPWILAPTTTTGSAGADRLRRFVEGLGGHVHVMSPDRHDAVVAYLSHLPQLASSALMQLVGERAGAEGLALAGRGLIDATRLASSPVDIWRDITATNHDNIDRAIDELVGLLLRLKSDGSGAGDPLAATFASAAHWKRVLDEEGRKM